ncbi:hypothetical protein [Arthrobacter oryzae]|uniref:hypothetical protein n=1 Tax=Arthrobacter oryzae TaxID=409290 RepID=UPI00273B08C3|nr:hypothetical protein [Arthrobacter oryzae]WLQ07152.1 hypothetical protein Q8Z05_03080 [Arthrobacter oryzae]
MSKRIFAVIAAVVTALFLFSSPATAGNPHFIKNATTATLQGSDLVVNFKEAGLPSGAVEFITVTALLSTTYECVNNGGKNPKASNKTTTQTQGSVTEPFTADKNGNIVGSLTLEPPTADALGFSCPSGQTVTFVSVTYSNVTISSSPSGASLRLGGPFTYTNPLAP